MSRNWANRLTKLGDLGDRSTHYKAERLYPMPSNEPRTYSFALNGWGFWLGCLALALLLTRLGLGWLIALPILLLAIVLTLPILMVVVFRWWVRSRLSTDTCPVCRFESQAMEGTRFFCPSCSEPLYVADSRFFRQSPPGTVEVEVIEDY